MLSYKEKFDLDNAYADIVEKIGACYVKCLKINPDDYKNDVIVTGSFDRIRSIMENNDADLSVESDDPTTTADDVYSVADVIAALDELAAAYDDLNESLAESADAIIEKGAITDLKELLVPYSK